MNLDSPRRKATQRAPQSRALKSQLREVVRAQILDAAEELIAARGLHGAALAQIARKAGVAVGTLYNYFADRDAMIRALFDARRAVLRPKLLAAVDAGAGLEFEPRLRAVVRALFDVFEEHRRFIKVSMETEHTKIAPSTMAADLGAAIEQLIAAGVAEKALAPAPGKLLVPVILGAMKAIIMKRIVDGTSFGADADVLVSIFLDGARKR